MTRSKSILFILAFSSFLAACDIPFVPLVQKAPAQLETVDAELSYN